MKKLNTPKFLESLKSIKLPNSLKSFKSPNSIKFDKTKTAKAASSIVLFGFSGWFIWQTFLAAPEPALPPALPQAVATIATTPTEQVPTPVIEPIKTDGNLTVTEPEELIEPTEELLAASEAQEEVDEAPNQLSEETQQASMETPELATKQFEPDALYETTELHDDEPTTEITILASTPVLDEAPQEIHPYRLTARSNLDARDCLTLTKNMAIHQCAESYR